MGLDRVADDRKTTNHFIIFYSPIALTNTLPWNKYVDGYLYYFVDNDCWFYLIVHKIKIDVKNVSLLLMQ